jgi:hypothetical protein
LITFQAADDHCPHAVGEYIDRGAEHVQDAVYCQDHGHTLQGKTHGVEDDGKHDQPAHGNAGSPDGGQDCSEHDDPLLPHSQVKTIYLAMKMVATHSYKAVPSMLMVAPMGSTKPAAFSEAPDVSVTAFMVNGSVTMVEQVEKAVIRADSMPR